MQPILLVDDDRELTKLLATYLSAEDINSEAAHDGQAGAALALSGRFQMVILDVMMPGQNGIETLRQIRQHSQIPILMLTAKGDDIDRIIGLELGADDYVPKPCSPREILARIRAILRRATATSPSPLPNTLLSHSGLTLSPTQRHAQWRGQELDLTSTEFSLLEVLMTQAGSIVSKAQLSERALGRKLMRFDRSIDVHISSIRQKLSVFGEQQPLILTVRGQGYQLRVD
ncbi:MAG: response regulator transcription factor [Paraperlucidibaca sp.]